MYILVILTAFGYDRIDRPPKGVLAQASES